MREVVAEIDKSIPNEERVIALDRVLAHVDKSQSSSPSVPVSEASRLGRSHPPRDPDIARSFRSTFPPNVRAARRGNRKLLGCYWTWPEPDPNVTALSS